MATSSEAPEGKGLSTADGRMEQVLAVEETQDTKTEEVAEIKQAPSPSATDTASPPQTTQPTADVEASVEDKKAPENAVAPDSAEKPETLGRTTTEKYSPTNVVQPTSLAVTPSEDSINPPDFKGEVDTNNEIPSLQVLRAIENYTVFDRDGKTHPFRSLYTGHNVARRVLIIFIRHFFCGNCQEYLRMLSASITPEALLGLPVSTFIAVIGCGSHKLIDTYIEETKCPFPVYADPTRQLYQELGMIRTLNMGPRPAYLQNKSVAKTVVSGIFQGLKQVKSGLVMKMGDQRQVGGEFLFEPASKTLETPLSSPVQELDKELNLDQGPGKVEEKCITWCHRMRTTRDHVEIPELMEVLGIQGDGQAIRDEKKWQKALKSRKGTGLSLASQMSRMSVDSAKTGGPAKTKTQAQ